MGVPPGMPLIRRREPERALAWSGVGRSTASCSSPLLQWAFCPRMAVKSWRGEWGRRFRLPTPGARCARTFTAVPGRGSEASIRTLCSSRRRGHGCLSPLCSPPAPTAGISGPAEYEIGGFARHNSLRQHPPQLAGPRFTSRPTLFPSLRVEVAASPSAAAVHGHTTALLG